MLLSNHVKVAKCFWILLCLGFELVVCVCLMDAAQAKPVPHPCSPIGGGWLWRDWDMCGCVRACQVCGVCRRLLWISIATVT